MSVLGAVQQGFPNVSLPLTDDKGQIQQAWLQLLIALWKRTGDGPGDAIWVPGDIKQAASAGPQVGWLVCDGAAYSRTAFSDLYSAIGTTWGAGDGSTTFNVPDFRNRTLIEVGSNPLGTVGGSDTVSIAVTNLPAHNHPVSDPGHTHTFTGAPHTHTITDPGHVHHSVVSASTNTAGSAAGSVTAGDTDSATTGITINNATATGTNATATTGVTTQNTGSGTPFSILPPFAAVTVLIKT